MLLQRYTRQLHALCGANGETVRISLYAGSVGLRTVCSSGRCIGSYGFRSLMRGEMSANGQRANTLGGSRADHGTTVVRTLRGSRLWNRSRGCKCRTALKIVGRHDRAPLVFFRFLFQLLVHAFIAFIPGVPSKCLLSRQNPFLPYSSLFSLMVP
ncbi:unnamed protein product [Mycena citricolor]|uniref:Uncharacterized protein n=1 Tax=Mycena citricolor TaxID=2018698 RepID=A0AAD2HZ34_9AGAR|nr:unnamed protein product [Mycena citricolor]